MDLWKWNLKQIIARNRQGLSLCMVLIFALTGCAGNSEPSERNPQTMGTGEQQYGYQVQEYTRKEPSAIWCAAGDKIYSVQSEYGLSTEDKLEMTSVIYVENPGEGSRIKLGSTEGNVRKIDVEAEDIYLLKESNGENGRTLTLCQWQQEDPREVVIQNGDTPYPTEWRQVEDYCVLWSPEYAAIYGADGERLWDYACEEGESLLDICAWDEAVFICSRSAEGVISHTQFQRRKLSDGSLSQRLEMEEEIDVERMAPRQDQEFWIANSHSGIFIYRMQDNTLEQVVSWQDEGISNFYVTGICSSDEQGLRLMGKHKTSGTESLINIKYGLLEAQQDRKELTLCIPWLSNSMKEAVVAFNKQNKEYKILLQSQFSNVLYQEYRDNLGQFLATGDGADIFLLPPEDYEIYRKKGMLMDVMPLLLQNPEWNRDAYFDKVWNHYEENGQLYALPISFYLTTYLAPKGAIDFEKSWTFSDMQKTLLAMPEVAELLVAGSKEDVLEYCCGDMVASNQLQNMSDSELASLLAYAAQYGCSDARLAQYQGQMYYAFDKNRNLLLKANIKEVGDIPRYRALMEGDFDAVSYPGDHINTAYILSNTVLTVSSNCSYPDGVGAFLRFLLSTEIQEKQENFPVRKDILQERITRTENLMEDSVTVGIYVGDTYIPIEAPTTQDADLVRTLVEKAAFYPYETTPLWNILQEEAQYYFTGEKSAEDTARIILNRVQLYLAE